MGAKKIVEGAKSAAESAKKKLPPGMNKSTLPQEERVTRSFGLKDRPIIDPQPEPNFPGIWDSPKDLAQQAADRVAPESEFLNRLFGVTREDLYEQSLIPGNVKGSFEGMDGPGKSRMAQRVMTPRNTQRMQDQLAEAQKHPELFMGMHGWYQFDPVYQRLLQLMPKDEADAAFTRLNHFLGMSSPGSEVSTEIQRGLAANYFNDRGAFDLFEQYGGMPLAKKQELMRKAVEDRNNYLMAHPELATIMGHPYHSTSQAPPMSQFIQGGALDMDSPKVPLYIQASGSRHHPLGVQSDSAVPDAHFSRNIGMSDVRGGKDANRNASLKTPEAVPIVRWWRNDVTDPLGMQAVPGQAIAWGVGSKATGVESAIGAPKLELLSNHIARRAKETGLPLDFVRDQMLMGKMFNEGGSVKRSPLNQMRAPASFQRDLDQARRERAERDVADQRARSEMYDDLRFATQVPGAIGTLAMEGVDYARENPLQAAINTGQFAYDVFVPQSMTDVGVMLAGSAMGGPLAGPIVRAAPKIGRAIAPIIGSPVRRGAAGSAMIAADPDEIGATQNYNEGGSVTGSGMNMDNKIERAPLPKPETPTFDGMSFEKAFAAARRVNAPRFMWRGKPYTTELKRESAGDIERRVERRIPQAPAPQQDEAAVREAEMPSRLYQRPVAQATPAYDAFGPPRPFLSAPEQMDGLMPYEGAAAPRLNPAQMQGALRRFGRMDMDPSSFAYRFARTMR